MVTSVSADMMFDLNCAAKGPPRRHLTETAPKSAPLPRKAYDRAGSGADTVGKGLGKRLAFKMAAAGSKDDPTTEPSLFTYVNFSLSTSRCRTERQRRKLVFDYVPWSLLDRYDYDGFILKLSNSPAAFTYMGLILLLADIFLSNGALKNKYTLSAETLGPMNVDERRKKIT